jgi:hypothetical protein
VMKLPPKNTRMMKILETLCEHGPYTVLSGAALHGRFQLSLDSVADFYEQLVTLGCARRLGVRYEASEAAIKFIQGLDEPASCAESGPVVPPRAATPFRPLATRNIASSRGLRPGSNDLRDVVSLHVPRIDNLKA